MKNVNKGATGRASRPKNAHEQALHSAATAAAGGSSNALQYPTSVPERVPRSIGADVEPYAKPDELFGLQNALVTPHEHTQPKTASGPAEQTPPRRMSSQSSSLSPEDVVMTSPDSTSSDTPRKPQAPRLRPITPSPERRALARVPGTLYETTALPSSMSQAPSYGSAQWCTLRQVLEVDLARPPPFYKPNRSRQTDRDDDKGAGQVLTETKNITTFAVDYAKTKRIDFVVWAGDMLEPFIDQAKVELDTIPVSWSNPRHQVAIAFVHPWTTRHGLPSDTYSEKDVEQWCLNIILQPAHIATKMVAAKDVATDAIFEQAVSYWTPGTQGTQDKVRPDFLYMLKYDDEDNKEIPLVVEVKSDNVLQGRASGGGVGRESAYVSIFDKLNPKLFRDCPGVGYAMPFNWPSSTEAGKNNKMTKLLVQIVMEMAERVTPKASDHDGLAILTSYECTIFFVLIEKTLYISRQYVGNDAPILATYAFLRAAQGMPGKFNLPQVDKAWLKPRGDWKTELAKDSVGGIPAWAMPSAFTS